MKNKSIISVMIFVICTFFISCCKQSVSHTEEISVSKNLNGTTVCTRLSDFMDHIPFNATLANLFDNITNTKLIDAIRHNVMYDADTRIESYEWVNEEKSCLRIRIQYKIQPENSYRHKEDYFFFCGQKDDIQVLYVDYPSKDYRNIEKDRYVWDACDFNAYFEDVTFDGHADLVIFLGHAGVHGTDIHGAYIYENGHYCYEPAFEDIPNYEIDTENEVITGYNVDSAVSTTHFIY